MAASMDKHDEIEMRTAAAPSSRSSMEGNKGTIPEERVAEATNMDSINTGPPLLDFPKASEPPEAETSDTREGNK